VRDPREIRTLVRLRAFLLIWTALVVGVFAPVVLLALLLVPQYLGAYRRRLERPRRHR
jgi:hypothetical protein